MSGVFQNIDPPSPHPLASVYTPAFGAGGRTHSLGGWGVNILEDARHSSVLYICKYFVFAGLRSKKIYTSQLRPPYPTPHAHIYLQLCREGFLFLPCNN